MIMELKIITSQKCINRTKKGAKLYRSLLIHFSTQKYQKPSTHFSNFENYKIFHLAVIQIMTTGYYVNLMLPQKIK
jgi:hypothetical protein